MQDGTDQAEIYYPDKRKENKKKNQTLHSFSGQVLSQWCDCPAFSVLDICIYVQFYLCVFILSFFYKKKKKCTLKKKKKNFVVFHSLA